MNIIDNKIMDIIYNRICYEEAIEEEEILIQYKNLIILILDNLSDEFKKSNIKPLGIMLEYTIFYIAYNEIENSLNNTIHIVEFSNLKNGLKILKNDLITKINNCYDSLLVMNKLTN